MRGCEARQYSDTMTCGRCGLQWDVNDPGPPECKPAGEGMFDKDATVLIPFKPTRLRDHAAGFSSSPELERRTVDRLLEMLK